MSRIYTDNFQVIKNEIEYLLNAIYSCNDKYDKLNLYSACELLIYVYWSYNKEGIDYYRKLNKYKSFILEQRNRIKQINSKYLADFLSKKDFHLDFCEQFLADIREIEYADLEYFLPAGLQYEEEEKYDIFKEFLEKYHPSTIELFDFLVNTGKIFYTSDLSNEDTTNSYDTSGINIFNIYGKDYYLFIKEQASSAIELSSLAHEFGHTVDYENILATNSKKDYSYYTFKSPFVETISSMFEMEFCEFCLDNHIETKYIKNNLQEYYLNIIDHLSELNLICHLPDSIFKCDKYKKVSKEKLYNTAKKSCELAVDFDNFCNPNELNYGYNIEYGYGRFLATYFSYLRKNNPSKYIDNFDNFLKFRNNYFPTDMYQRLGTSIEEMVDIVKEEINSKDVKIYLK